MNRTEYKAQVMYGINKRADIVPEADRLAVLEEAREEIQDILNEAREAALEGWSPPAFPNPCTEPDCVAEPGPRDEKYAADMEARAVDMERQYLSEMALRETVGAHAELMGYQRLAKPTLLQEAELTIKKLEPKEGDVLLLIIKSDDIDAETVTRVRSHFRTFLADAACKKVVVLGMGSDDEIDAQVVKNEVIKEYLKAPLSPLEAIAKLTKALEDGGYSKNAPPLPQGCGYPAAEVTAHVPSAPIPIDQVINNVAEVDPEEDFAKRLGLGEEIKPETK